MDNIGAHWFVVAYTFTPLAEWEPDDEDMLGDETDKGDENEEDANEKEAESLEVEDPSYEEVQRMVNGVALDLCMAASKRCCSLKDLYSELRKTHAWFRRCAGHGVKDALDGDAFMVSNGTVHII